MDTDLALLAYDYYQLPLMLDEAGVTGQTIVPSGSRREVRVLKKMPGTSGFLRSPKWLA